MNRTTKDILHTEATEVRHWAERRATGTKNEKDLNGWCARASAELWRKLNAVHPELNPKICMAEGMLGAHVYIKIDDHIVDVTATQFPEFRYEPIVIEHEKELQHWFYETSKTFDSPTELLKDQKKHKWPKNQLAFSR